jgi:integrase
MKHIIKLGEIYYYNRRVPEELRHLDSRETIRQSLKTDSKSQAIAKGQALNEQVEAYWQELASTETAHCNSRFRKLVNGARRYGFSYIPMNDVRQLPFEELAQRIIALEGKTTNFQVEALLGGKPQASLSGEALIEKYWLLTQEKVLGKTVDQIRKWKNPRIKAVNNFVAASGITDLSKASRADVEKLKNWWLERVKKEGKNSGSANKDLIHLKDVLQTVSESEGLNLDIDRLFKKVMLKTRFQQTRLPFTPQQIITMFSAKQFEQINPKFRAFLYAISETGARPSEIVGLLPEDIVLDAEIPHIKIVDRKDRPLKTANSERTIPLVGYSLKGFRMMPGGMPEYRDKPDNLTNAVNKALRENDFLPSKRHTIYSFRHSFQDRILNVNAPDRVQAELMGHRFSRPKYGDGATLQQKKDWLEISKLERKSDDKMIYNEGLIGDFPDVLSADVELCT